MEPRSPGVEALSILLHRNYVSESSILVDENLKDEVKVEAVRILFRGRLSALTDRQIIAAIDKAIDTMQAQNERAWRGLTRDLEEEGA